jgi:NADH-quinone oxidoreductase subunit H
MALGWKVLIPVSLAWIVAVATIRVISLEGNINRTYLVAAIAVLLVLTVGLMFVGDKGDTSDEEAAVEASEEPHDAFAGGFPVPPMPTGGAVRGGAAPLTFAQSRTTVTAAAEENHE